jgi:hypothetical protein
MSGGACGYGGAWGMAEVSEEAIRAYWKDHREQMRQCETQLSTLTNLVLILTAALSALVVQQEFTLNVVPLCVFVALAGVYGAVAVSKYYERAAYHLLQARALTQDLKELGVLGDDVRLVQARAEHNRRFPRLHRIRLHRLWMVLHLVIACYGLALLTVCVVVS